MGQKFDIGRAINEVKHHGMKVRRAGWREGNWIVYQKGYPDGIPINKNTAEATGIPQGTVVKFQPYIMAHTPDGTFVPWSPWIVDVLAEDWELVL